MKLLKKQCLFITVFHFLLFPLTTVWAQVFQSDSLSKNTNNSGLPGTGNILQPNNGPEFPHSSFPVQSTDPGTLYHGPSNVTFDSISDPQKYAKPQ